MSCVYSRRTRINRRRVATQHHRAPGSRWHGRGTRGSTRDLRSRRRRNQGGWGDTECPRCWQACTTPKHQNASRQPSVRPFFPRLRSNGFDVYAREKGWNWPQQNDRDPFATSRSLLWDVTRAHAPLFDLLPALLDFEFLHCREPA